MHARTPLSILGALVLAIGLAACPADDPDEPALEDQPGVGDGTPAATPEETPDAPTDPADDAQEEALHPGPPEGHEEPPPPGEDRHVLAFDVGEHDGFTRVVMTAGEDYDTETEVPPLAEAEDAPDYGAVRIHLEDVVGGSADPVLERQGDVVGVHHAGSDFDTQWVDIFVDEAAQAQVFRLTDPARVVVDLIPVEAGWGGFADQSSFGVLLEPDPQIEHRGDAMLVYGYARPFEAHANIVVTDDHGEVVAEEPTSTAMWAEAAGQFELTLDTSEWEPGTYTITVEQTPGHEEGETVMLETQIEFAG